MEVNFGVVTSTGDRDVEKQAYSGTSMGILSTPHGAFSSWGHPGEIYLRLELS